MNLEVGTIIELDHEEEYVVMNKVTYQGEEYLFLITSKRPISIKVAQEVASEEELSVDIIEDPELIKGIFEEAAKQQ